MNSAVVSSERAPPYPHGDGDGDADDDNHSTVHLEESKYGTENRLSLALEEQDLAHRSAGLACERRTVAERVYIHAVCAERVCDEDGTVGRTAAAASALAEARVAELVARRLLQEATIDVLVYTRMKAMQPGSRSALDRGCICV